MDEIVLRLHQNDEKAFLEIFKKFATPLIYLASTIVVDRQESEDVVGESFLKLYEKRKNFYSLRAIKSFLYLCTRNRSLNILKNKKRMQKSHEEILFMSDEFEELDRQEMKSLLMEKIMADIETLPEKRKKIFKLHRIDGMNMFDIASQLNLSIDTVRVQVARATNFLKSKKDEYLKLI